jgi:MFS family permease
MRLITRERLADGPGTAVPGSGYRWIALSNTTLGTLMATINGSIILIALPDIFRGIGVNPLLPGNASLLLWLILGYLLVTAVLVVTFGRLGDMFGRVRIYTLGFAVFTVFSILLGVTWLHGTAGALWLIAMRILQAVGGAMLFANAAAILTDAFPADHRGMALGLNQVAGIAGQFVGLILGGLLGPVAPTGTGAGHPGPVLGQAAFSITECRVCPVRRSWMPVVIWETP